MLTNVGIFNKSAVGSQQSAVFHKIFQPNRYISNNFQLIDKRYIMATGIENLIVFQKSFRLAMDIFECSKNFPKEEKYSLTDQIRRSSRSVTANLAEAYRKRKYKAHFVSKLSDADMENTETLVWLKFCLSCRYITDKDSELLIERNREIGRMIDHMINHPEKFQRNW